ncbi:MAG: SUMO ligase siz1 [Claussenomyces sp. TS43310]|nr:MAG: SUMO ligase siz1 [Claussenomyces sp. TS43310]
MAGMGGGPYLDVDPVLRLTRGSGMLNKFLIAICRAESLHHVGVKAELQNRISERIKQYAAAGDVPRFEQLKEMLENPHRLQPPQSAARSAQISSSPAAPPPRAAANLGGMNGLSTVNEYPGRSSPNTFKPSPFYTIQQQIGETKACDIMAAHRNTVGIPIKAGDYAILRDAVEEKSLRVMVFCASEGGLGYNQDVAFPYQSEIKVNGGEIKANLKGLKNKPGSTRPVDITDALRLKPAAYTNNVDLTYALTTKKFFLSIYAVKRIPISDLVQKIESGKRITKDSVLREMESKAADPDIVTTSTVLSLKSSYLQLQEQAPTWMCPECNIPAPFESLVVDDYVNEILSMTHRSTEQVTVEPGGNWSQNAKPASTPNLNVRATKLGSSEEDDDDLIEIKDIRVNALKKDSTPVTSMLSRTPPASSREPSISSASRNSISSKRPISAVIDLTGSDEDEDDEPISKLPKRLYGPKGYGTPQSAIYYNGLHGP